MFKSVFPMTPKFINLFFSLLILSIFSSLLPPILYNIKPIILFSLLNKKSNIFGLLKNIFEKISLCFFKIKDTNIRCNILGFVKS